MSIYDKNPEENRNIVGVSQHNKGNRQEAQRQLDPKQRKLKAFPLKSRVKAKIPSLPVPVKQIT